MPLLALFLHVPLLDPPGRRLRVVIYARYSTEEQRASSIDDQVAACRRALADWGVTDYDLVVHSDPETSGELRSRPGIDAVRLIVQELGCDLLLCEDSSRLFRDETACFELVETAVDNDIRVICINDDVDTAQESWPERLHEAQRHHCRSNAYIRMRVRRSQMGRWERGEAMGPLKPGYRRRPTMEATDREPAQGPFYDEIDPKWVPTVYEVYLRIAFGDPPWAVGEWLRPVGLPRASNAQSSDWNERAVIHLIRDPVYRGLERYRETHSKKRFRTGRSKQEPTPPEEQWKRSMEHHRMVPDWLWYAANAAIDEQQKGTPSSGRENPLYGIPRDSRGPLSQLAVCGVCGAKAYRDAGHDSAYRCKDTRALRGDCWNRATAEQALVHERIGRAVASEILSLNGHLPPILAAGRRRIEDDEPRRREIAELRTRVRDLERRRGNLHAAVGETDEPGVRTGLLEQLKSIERTVAKSRARIERLEEQPVDIDSIDSATISEHLDEAAGQMLDLDRSAGVLLSRLIPGKIELRPYQRIDCGLVVLRAHFRIELTACLPDALRLALAGENPEDLGVTSEVREMVVDLFDEPPFVALRDRIFAMRSEKRNGRPPSYQTIADHLKQEGLDVTKMTVKRALTLKSELDEAGLTEPYRRLVDRPSDASRWRLPD